MYLSRFFLNLLILTAYSSVCFYFGEISFLSACKTILFDFIDPHEHGLNQVVLVMRLTASRDTKSADKKKK